MYDGTLPDRSVIRQWAARLSEALREATQKGISIDQITLEQEDWLHDQISQYDEDVQIYILSIYNEELNEIAEKTIRGAEELEQRATEIEAGEQEFSYVDVSKFDGRIPSRQTIRGWAETEWKEVKEAEGEGKNIHQLMLDQRDELNRRISSYSMEEKAAILNMHAEEMQAVISHFEDGLSNPGRLLARNSALPSREVIREWVSRETHAYDEAMRTGADAERVQVLQKRELEERIAKFSIDERAAILNIYNEEFETVIELKKSEIHKTKRELTRLQAEERRSEEAGTAGAMFGIIIVCLFLLFVASQLFSR